jgi:hypothetical protein
MKHTRLTYITQLVVTDEKVAALMEIILLLWPT